MAISQADQVATTKVPSTVVASRPTALAKLTQLS